MPRLQNRLFDFLQAQIIQPAGGPKRSAKNGAGSSGPAAARARPGPDWLKDAIYSPGDAGQQDELHRQIRDELVAELRPEGFTQAATVDGFGQRLSATGPPPGHGRCVAAPRPSPEKTLRYAPSWPRNSASMRS